MRDPQVLEITVDTATQLTKLVAAYGIYAILILFMFYQQSRERKCLAEAKTPKQETYYKIRGNVVLGFTILLALLASCTWIYATFIYQAKVVIEGRVRNLHEQKVMPVKIGDPPGVTYRLDAYANEARFYSGQQGEGAFGGLNDDLDWALISRRGVNTLHLILQQELSTVESDAQDLQILMLDQQSSLPKVQKRSIIKHATIRFRDLQESLDGQIELEYQPGSDIKEIGRLKLVHDEGTTPIPWVSDDEGSPRPAPVARSASLGMGVAWAQSQPPAQVFGPRGEVSEDAYRSLRAFLEGEDLKQQVLARDTLVEAGARSFPTVARLLREQAADPNARNRLVHNIAGAVEKIESPRSRIPPELSLALARSLFELGDYELSAAFFLRIPDSHDLSLQESHQRALAYLKAEHYEKAEKEFVQLLQETGNSGRRSTITTNLGTVYSRQGKWEDAIRAYRRALALDPKNVAALYNLGSVEVNLGNYAEAEKIFEQGYGADPKNPFVLNGLAYTYAQQDKSLDTALSYAEQALASNAENPQFLDTKGWVLYKKGQPRQALEYLQKAHQKQPENGDIKDHLETVRRELLSG